MEMKTKRYVFPAGAILVSYWSSLGLYQRYVSLIQIRVTAASLVHFVPFPNVNGDFSLSASGYLVSAALVTGTAGVVIVTCGVGTVVVMTGTVADGTAVVLA